MFNSLTYPCWINNVLFKIKACLPAADITQQKSKFPPKHASIPECVCVFLQLHKKDVLSCMLGMTLSQTIKRHSLCFDGDTAAHFLAKSSQHKCLFLEGQCSWETCVWSWSECKQFFAACCGWNRRLWWGTHSRVTAQRGEHTVQCKVFRWTRSEQLPLALNSFLLESH